MNCKISSWPNKFLRQPWLKRWRGHPLIGFSTLASQRCEEPLVTYCTRIAPECIANSVCVNGSWWAGGTCQQCVNEWMCHVVKYFEKSVDFINASPFAFLFLLIDILCLGRFKVPSIVYFHFSKPKWKTFWSKSKKHENCERTIETVQTPHLILCD